MKKYLMSGIAALAFGSLFTSCSHDIDSAGTVEEKVQKTYEEAFLTRFGQPAPTQDWGFGSSAAKARTRAEYANANMWADEGYTVPPELTAGQKLRVQYYFQTVKITNPNTPDYKTIDFWMQQVYDGGDDAMTKYKKDKTTVDGKEVYVYSTEIYKSIAGGDIKSGEHMDHLTAGPDHTHINNFNNGTYGTNGAANNDVLNSEGVEYHSTYTKEDGRKYHSDQIMLMKSTNTKFFGYANSDDSYVRDDRWTLVSYDIIDAYCNDAANGYEAWRSANHSDIKDDILTDGWNRSFIGFDFDQLPDDEAFVYNYENGKKTTPKTVVYSGWASPQGGENYIYNEDGTFSQITNWNAEITVDGGKKLHVLDANTNFYCGIVQGMDNMDGHNELTMVAEYDPNGTNDNSLYIKNLPINGVQNDHTALNMKFLAKMYREGWVPVDTKQLKLWVQVGGCADGYYSDWIVSFLPANSGSNPEKREVITSVRVIAEDLSVGQNTDFDFNDVVYDVFLKKTYEGESQTPISTEVTVTLKAAGGTLPLIVGIGNESVEGKTAADYAAYEVHNRFSAAYPDRGIDQYTMINTDAEQHGMRGVSGLAGITFTPDYYAGETVEEIANSIKVYVEKGGVLHPLTAPVGDVASKIAVGIDYDWCYERQDIEEKYSTSNGVSLFMQYVKGEVGNDWYKAVFEKDN